MHAPNPTTTDVNTTTTDNSINTNTTAASVDIAQGDAAAIEGRGGVKAVKKVKFSTSKCLMLIQGKYADLLGDANDRRICRAARLTGCTTRLNTSIARRNKHGELCFVVTVQGRRDSDVEKFKRLIRDKFPDILFTRA
ncbi:unnamed protein product [Rodentolepis nana]|uniref:SUI1 domain-containing protein n=1 Tax=Rodentolepis nana TaxID=102285 RepID=A0A0R3TLL2_RODNA|nr:unnamed protein product [Rodentolepis nana]